MLYRNMNKKAEGYLGLPLEVIIGILITIGLAIALYFIITRTGHGFLPK